MKKLIALLLVLAMALSMVACGGAAEKPAEEQPAAAPKAAPEAAPEVEAEPVEEMEDSLVIYATHTDEEMEAWKRDYPEAFARKVHPDAGVCLDGWLIGGDKEGNII